MLPPRSDMRLLVGTDLPITRLEFLYLFFGFRTQLDGIGSARAAAAARALPILILLPGFHLAGKNQRRHAFKRIKADSVTHADSTPHMYNIAPVVLSDGSIKNFRPEIFFGGNPAPVFPQAAWEGPAGKRWNGIFRRVRQPDDILLYTNASWKNG